MSGLYCVMEFEGKLDTEPHNSLSSEKLAEAKANARKLFKKLAPKRKNVPNWSLQVWEEFGDRPFLVLRPKRRK